MTAGRTPGEAARLLPCPFCGSQPESIDIGFDVVSCPSCGIEGPVSPYHTKVESWNRRATSPPAADAQARPVAHFLNDARAGAPHHYTQVALEFIGTEGVFPLYEHPAAANGKTLYDALGEQRIDRIADTVIRGMEGGIRGFCRTWGWQDFARELLRACAVSDSAADAQAEDAQEIRDRNDWQELQAEHERQLDDLYQRLTDASVNDQDAERWRYLKGRAYTAVLPHGNRLNGSRVAWIIPFHTGASFEEAIDAARAAQAGADRADG